MVSFMQTMTHSPSGRVLPGLARVLACLMAAGGLWLVPQSLGLGISVVLAAVCVGALVLPRGVVSCRICSQMWTVHYGGQVLELPLKDILEVRVDDPFDGPDRVHVLMQDGLCVPLPDAAMPPIPHLTTALRARGVTLRIASPT